MMRNFTLLWSLLMVMILHEAQAQDEKEVDSIAVLQIIQEVFDGMRAGDSSMISKHLLPGVGMHSVGIGPNG
jgi:hypothetical protein